MIEDEEDVSRVGTPSIEKNPVIVAEGSDGTNGATKCETDPEKEESVVTQPPEELPLEVRTKLRKLEKMESRYQGQRTSEWAKASADTYRTTQIISDCT